jgi:hypothetical protein
MKTTTKKTREIVKINGIDYSKQSHYLILAHPLKTFDWFHTYTAKN